MALERSGSSDAVVLSFVCTEPTRTVGVGVSALVAAATQVAADLPGGATDQVEGLGGSLSISQAGGLLTLSATGPEGSAGRLARSLVSLCAGSPTARDLNADGGLAREIEARTSRGPGIEGRAVRALLGRAWWPDAEDVLHLARTLSEAELDGWRATILCGRRCYAAVASADAQTAPLVRDALEAIPAGPAAAGGLVRGSQAGTGLITAPGEIGADRVGWVAAGPEPASPESAAWHVAAFVLGRGNDGWLFRRLRSEMGLCYWVGARWAVDYGGLLWIEARCPPEAAATVLEGIAGVVARLATSGPTPAEAERARRLASLDWTDGLMSPERRARLRAAGMAWRAGPTWVNEHASALLRVTAEDIRRAGQTCRERGVAVHAESQTLVR